MSNKTKSSLTGATEVAGPGLPVGSVKSGDKLAPAPVYLLADHLDAVLASGEDLTRARIVWDMSGREDMTDILHHRTNVRAEIENIRAFENAIIVRVLKSRDRVAEVMRADERFVALGKLYLAGTAVLLDAVEECGDCTAIDFDTADSIPAYLRSRGLVAADAPAPSDGDTLAVTDKFLIAKRIPIGPLMDLAATFLDSLETHFDLFLDEDELPMPPLVDRVAESTIADAKVKTASIEAEGSAVLFDSQLADVRAALAEAATDDDPLPRFMTSGDTEAESEAPEVEAIEDAAEPVEDHDISPDLAASEPECELDADDDRTNDGDDQSAETLDIEASELEASDIETDFESAILEDTDDTDPETAAEDMGDTSTESGDPDEILKASDRSPADDNAQEQPDGEDDIGLLENSKSDDLEGTEADENADDVIGAMSESESDASDLPIAQDDQVDGELTAAENEDADNASDDDEVALASAEDDREPSIDAADSEPFDIEADANDFASDDIDDTSDGSDEAEAQALEADSTEDEVVTADMDQPKPTSLIRRLRLVK